MKKVIERYLTTPIWCYVILLLILIGEYILAKFNILLIEESILSNIFCGVLVTFFTTIIIDFGNTRRQQMQTKEMKERLKSGLKCVCEELPYYAYECANEIINYSEYKKRSFSEWNNIIFSPLETTGNIDENHKGQIRYYMQNLIEINKRSDEFLNLINYYQQYFTDEDEPLIKDIKALKSVSRRAKIEFNSNDINMENNTKMKNLIVKNLPEKIIKVFPELKTIYEEPYDDEELFGEI